MDARLGGAGAPRATGDRRVSLANLDRRIKKELGPIAGIMQRKVGLVGSFPIVVRFIKSAEALVDAATRVPTRFLDDGPPQC